MITKRQRRAAWITGVVLLAGIGGYISTWVLYPAEIVPERRDVPALRGMTGEDALARLNTVSLRGRIMDSVVDAIAPAGTVAWQSPAPGTSLPTSAIVRMGVSKGTALLVVPDLEGFELGLAEEVLQVAGLTLGAVDTIRSRADAGTIVRTVPPSGAAVRLRQSVAVSVSQGVATIRLPLVIGMSLEDARDRLAAAGLKIGTLRQTLDGTPGTVQEQFPVAGTLVTKGQPITLSVSGVME